MTKKVDRATESPEAARQARGLERFLMFSDGVAAIAVTLLILPLVDAVTSTDGERVRVVELLDELRWEIFSFVLSFIVIVVLWINHQQVFQNVASYSSTLLRAGVVWLFAVVTLSFTTALVTDHGNERMTVLLYITNLGLAMASLTVATWHLQRQPQLLHDGTAISPDAILDSYINLGLLVVAFGLVLVFPGLGFWVMTLLFVDRPVLSIVRRLQRGRSVRAVFMASTRCGGSTHGNPEQRSADRRCWSLSQIFSVVRSPARHGRATRSNRGSARPGRDPWDRLHRGPGRFQGMGYLRRRRGHLSVVNE